MEAHVKPAIALKKAELLAGGPVKISSDYRLPFLPSRSTAGPGAGTVSIVLAFGNARAKKPISRESGEFELVEISGKLRIMKAGKMFIDNVKLLPTLLHAPYQAFVNIDHACIYNCKFCNSPRLGHEVTKNLTDEKIINMILEASKAVDFESVAFTSAVSESPPMTIRRMAALVRKTRELLPEAPIGVEPYATHPRDIDELRDAGADEIKLNIESFDPEIFEKVCPDRDYGAILHVINHAGKVFGKNRVCSNIIFGLGESNETVFEGTKVLANMGAVATLRALRRSEYNISALEKALGPLGSVTPDRMLLLARGQKKVFEEYGLTPLKFKTMCHACLACDIVPFWDV
jgi:biotin synthase-related radical SAM superfamily protein